MILVLIILLFILALYFSFRATYRKYAFTLWIVLVALTAFIYPDYFTSIGDYKTKSMILPLLMIIMFGMGTSMNVHDFWSIIKMPKGVLVGIICQFSIMPIIGLMITSVFHFPPEIAAGIIMVGCSPSGLASNVMSYIAKANLALSLTLTAIATIMAPVMTPFLMKLLANQFVPVDFLSMMVSIIKIVIIPVIAGLVFNYYLHERGRWLRNLMPGISMFSIVVVIAVIIAAGKDNLVAIGGMLVLACIIHNVLGYTTGYYMAKLFRMDNASCRTIALEVGMQNSGLASGIALEMGRITSMGLAPIVFGPIMNITGSGLASYWKNHPVEPENRKKNIETLSAN